jgi:hypothetical protein
MNHFLLDLETLGIETPSIVLSIALTPFDFEADANTKFQELCDRTHFFKLSVKDQHEHKRSSDPSTIKWWGEQSKNAIRKSLRPLASDLLPPVALSSLKAAIGSEEATLWTRGALDQGCLESLCRTYGVEMIVPHNAYRDVRTALNLWGKSANSSEYIEGFIVHDPVHDCARDVMNLLKASNS